MTFGDRLSTIVHQQNSLLCIGLDPDPSRFPMHLNGGPDAIVAFNRAIIEATADLVCAFKPNLGFYLAHGVKGIQALIETRQLIPNDIPVILDAKVGDIGSTSAAYARGYFEELGFDAITANPYLGKDSLEPFLRYRDRGVFILAKNSNPGSRDFQDLPVNDSSAPEPLYLRVAEQVKEWQADYGTCGLVVGATYPDQLAEIRHRCPDLPILVPGVGAQGGELEATLRAGLDVRGHGVIINVARGVIYASSGQDFADAARRAAQRLRGEINAVRSAVNE